jgi:hypothetical protein
MKHDYAKALEDFRATRLRGDVYLNFDTLVCIEHALLMMQKLQQPSEGLVEALTYERDAIFYAMTTGKNYDIGLAKERMTKALSTYRKDGV